MDFDTRVKLVVYNRPLVRIDQLLVLATTWYSTRLQAEFRRPKPDEMRGIFAGLEGDFWDPT